MAQREEFLQKLEAQAKAFSLAFKDNGAVVRHLAEWVATNAPNLVGTAYWITYGKERDEGLDIRIWEHRVPRLNRIVFRLSALVGAKSFGGAISGKVFEATNGATFYIGLAATAPYSDFRKLGIGPVLTLRF